MDKKLDPSEIINPKKTLARREAEAEGAPVGGLTPSTERDDSQRKFLYGPKSKPKSKADEDRKRKSFEELQRKRDSEIKASSNTFEEEFSKDSDAPLTDAVRAARATATEPAIMEDAEYASAYDEEQKRAA